MNFQAPRSLEKGLSTQLRKVSAEILKICSSGADEQTIIFSLRNYAGKLGPWATKVMLDTVIKSNQRNEQAWRAMSKVLSEEIKGVYTQSAVSQAMTDLSREGARLISSLPSECAQDIAEAAAQWAAQTGRRYTSIQEEIYHLGQITEARAELIARTEVARQQSLLTQTRAVSIGSKGYIWRTADDGRVRPGHAALNGQYIEWDKPPECDPGYHAHAGQIFNCRCWPEPVVGENPGAVTPPQSVIAPPVKEALEITPQTEVTTPVLSNTKKEREALFGHVERRYRATVMSSFEDAPVETINAYKNYGSDIIVEKNYTGRGFQCDMVNGRVRAAASIPRSGFSSANGVEGEFQPMTTTKSAFVHEYGHALDGNIGRAVAKAQGWENLYVGQGVSTMDDAFSNAIDKYSTEIMTYDSPLRKALGVELGGNRITSRLKNHPPLSDICDALSDGTVHGNFGHGKNYWGNRPGAASKEIFADLSEVYALKDRSFWNELKGLFPDLIAAYEEIIKKAAMGGY